MAAGGSINIVVAHKAEAESLIELFLLERDQIDSHIYQNREIRLILSGMGVESAFQACKQMFGLNPSPDLWLNFGVAGSGEFEAGTFVVCNQYFHNDEVIAFNSIDIHKFDIPVTSANTVTKPETEFLQTGVFDMESFAIAQFVKSLKQQLISIKLISDGPTTPMEDVTPARLKSFLRRHQARQLELFKLLPN